MSTTTLLTLDCGCEFLEQLDTWGCVSLRIDPCAFHQTELAAFNNLLKTLRLIEAENAALRKKLIWSERVVDQFAPWLVEQMLKEQDDE